MPQGVFTEYDLLDAVVQLDQVWDEKFSKRGLEANTVTIELLKTEQIVNSINFESPDTKHIKTVVQWLKSVNCEQDASDCATPACDVPDGVELESGSQTYEIQKCVSHTVKVINKFSESSLERSFLIAEQLKALDQVICNKLNKAGVAFIGASLGDNLLTVENLEGQAIFDGATKLTTITASNTANKPAYFDMGLLPYIQLAAETSFMNNPFILDGSNFMMVQAEIAAGCKTGDCKEIIPITRDKYVNTLNPNLTTYVIDPASYAVVTENRFTEVPVTLKNPEKTIYKFKSKILPWLEIDITYQQVCIAGVYEDRFMGEVHYDFFLSPNLCNSASTGFLGFVKG